MIRALIVDDEPPARRRVRALLASEPDVAVVGECGTAREAVQAIGRERPDLVFLDVQMPEGDGFGVLEAVGPGAVPALVFVTAYSEHALRAFEVHALDYLLKPFDRARFRDTMARVRARLTSSPADQAAPGAALEARVRALLGDLGGADARRAERYVDRLPVQAGERIKLLAVDEIDYARAEENYVRLFAGDRSFLIRETLTGLAARLDPARFLRVHRSALVRIDRVREVEPLFQGEYVLFLAGGAKLTTGRSYRDAVRRAMNL